TYDFDANVSIYQYSFEDGVRTPVDTIPITDNTLRMLELYKSGKPVVVDDLEEFSSRTGIHFTVSGRPAMSMVFAPLISSGKIFGRISLQNLDRMAAFIDVALAL